MAKLYCYQKNEQGILDWVPITASNDGSGTSGTATYVAAVKTFMFTNAPIYNEQLKKMEVNFTDKRFVYNSSRDVLLVFRNGELLTPGNQYEILNDSSIAPVDDIRWTIDTKFLLIFFINAKVAENVDNFITLFKDDSITNNLLHTDIKIGSLATINNKIPKKDSITEIINFLYSAILALEKKDLDIGDLTTLSTNVKTNLVSVINYLNSELTKSNTKHSDDIYAMHQAINNKSDVVLSKTEPITINDNTFWFQEL